MNIVLVHNLIHYENVREDRLDEIAELDSEETIRALEAAMRERGHSVTALEADRNFPLRIRELRDGTDLVFNIAEGLRGEARESQVPVLLEMLDIAYTGSGPLTLAVCLDKVHTKEVLLAEGIPTAAYHVFHQPDDPIPDNLPFPLVVKLRGEGSSMGLSEDSLVHDRRSLRRQVVRMHDEYGSETLAEEYLPGREFTIPVLGYDEPFTLPVVESCFSNEDPLKMKLFAPDSWVADRLEVRVKPQDVQTRCPADIEPELETELRRLALAAFKALGCRDWCRMEFRLDKAGRPRLLELNPIAGIDPTYWLPRSARAAGMSYTDLVEKIIRCAAVRCRRIKEGVQ